MFELNLALYILSYFHIARLPNTHPHNLKGQQYLGSNPNFLILTAPFSEFNPRLGETRIHRKIQRPRYYNRSR